jgi:hypothetical protein
MEAAASPPSLAQVQAAFTSPISADAAAYLIAVRAAGFGWSDMSLAVAAGIGERFGAAGPRLSPTTVRRPSAARRIALALLLYILLRPLFGLGHELAVAGIAWVTHLLVASLVWQPLIGWIGLDPIYAGAAIRALGGVQVQGLAVGGALGDALHTLLPVLFQPPAHLADGAGISMVATPGAPALGRALAAFGADVVWLALGIWAFLRWRNRSWTLAALGVLVQAQIVVNHLFDAQVGIADLESSGLPFALALAVPGSGWFTTAIANQASVLQEILIGLALIALGYACGITVLGMASRLARLIRWKRSCSRAPTAGGLVSGPRHGLLVLVLAIVVATSPVGALALGESNWQAFPPAKHAPRLSGARLRGFTHGPRLGATPVAVVSDDSGTWTYLVDGQPDAIRGVGYNPQYAALSSPERVQLYQRDFAAMHQLGINTIEGWFEWQFDEVTLQAANRNEIGVIMPFELNQDWPYDDPNVRQSILDHITAFVERYKNSPAVRMWAPGNENLHRILYPRWVSREGDPSARARADAVAAFLPERGDPLHQLGPDHTVL